MHRATAASSWTVALAALTAGCASPPKAPAPPPVTALSPPTTTASGEPSLAARDGRIALGWIDTSPSGAPAFRLAVERDGAWSEPRVVVSHRDLLVNWADPPSLAWLDDGALAAQWVVREGPTGTRVFAAVSHDDGRSWSAERSPHRDTLPSEHGLPAILPSPGTGFESTWLDGRAGAAAADGLGATRLYHARWSADGFGEETLLDPRVCDCCKIGMARTSAGTVVAYRDRSEAELRDISVVRVEGAASTPPAPLHPDGWVIKACPTNGPATAASGPSILAAWFTLGGGTPRVLASRSDDGGRTFGPPQVVAESDAIGRVDVALLSDGTGVVVWLRRAGDGPTEVVVRAIEPSGAMGATVVVGRAPAGRAGGFPRVASPDGDAALVAWTAAGDPPTVRLASWRPDR